jgi:4-amino-4-deoxy-L-arabinose transferase-like glycosyltransferase
MITKLDQLSLSRCIPSQLKLLLVASAVLLLTWSLVVPVFEMPDEPHHWAYARYMHDYQRLPLYTPTMIEANQPPLYYWLISSVSTDTALPVYLGPSSTPRWYQNSRSDLWKYWPIRWARIITAFLSTLTILFSYFAGREATGSHNTGLLAGGLVAFLPEFTFRGVGISNDAMVATMSAITTYFMILLIRRGFSWPIGIVASLSVAFAFLSKISAVIFVPIFIGVLLVNGTDWRSRTKRLTVLLVGLVCTVPWLIRNQELYGDPLASKAMLRIVPVLIDKKPIWSPYFWNVFPRVLAQSFVGVFGWMNVYLPGWVYTAFALLALLGMIGLVRVLYQDKIHRTLLLVLTALPILAVASTIQLNLTFTQPQGRYLFPALTATAVLVAIGLESLPGWNTRVTYITLWLVAGINVYALLGVELPAYWLRQVKSHP